MSQESIARPIITAAEYAQEHNVSPDSVQRWAKEERLPGAYKSPDTERGTWLIPIDCQPPVLTPGRPTGGRKRAT